MLNKLFSLAGRTALVTGGSKGIGKAMARAFAEAGANIAISARHEDELKKAKAEIADGTNVKVEYFVADMTQRDQVKKLAKDVLAKLGRVDVLVNNAGSNKPQTLVDTTEEAWDEILELNLSSCYLLSHLLVPGMIERKWGRIIHTSSIMAMASNPGRGIYSGTKAALIGMARAHALELGPHGVTVNCLAPGPVATDMTAALSEQRMADLTAAVPLGRVATPDEIAGTVVFLASADAAYITGAVIPVDGGLGMGH